MSVSDVENNQNVLNVDHEIDFNMDNKENNDDLLIKMETNQNELKVDNEIDLNMDNKENNDDILKKTENSKDILSVDKEIDLNVVNEEDSDDLLEKIDDDNCTDDTKSDKIEQITVKGRLNASKKRLAIIDSDSEDENLPIEEDIINKIDQNDDNVTEDIIENRLKRLNNLCDSESSNEEEELKEDHDEDTSSFIPNKSNIHTNRNLKNLEKPKKMTPKEALEQRKEIRSESQRMTREMNVSLPYHKPKMRTIKEFFEKRPKFSSAVPDINNLVKPAVALKMNTEQLELISKKLSERKKQVEEYFKSDDEEEGENNENKDVKNDEKCDNKDENQEKIEEVEKNQEVNSPSENKNVNSDIIILKDILIQPPCNIESSTVKNKECNPNILEEKNQLDELIEKYNVEDEKSPVTTVPELKPKKITEIIKEKLGNFKPKLTKSDDFIDLDENVNELKQRFFKHTAKKHIPKHNVQLDIINVTNGEIHKEKLEITIEDDTIPIIEKPGERLKKLKDELQNKIAEEQAKFWQERLNNKKVDEDEENYVGKKIESDEEDILDKIDEEEFTEIEDDEDGDEIIQDDDNDEIDEEKEEEEEERKKKSLFLENEAEESERSDDDCDDNNDGDCDDNNDDDENDFNEEMEVDNNDDSNLNNEEKNLDADDEGEQVNATCSGDKKKKRKLKRIVQVFENDSDDETEDVTPTSLDVMEKNFNPHLDTTETMDDLSAPTPHQRQKNDYTPIKPNLTQTKSELGFLTPVIQLTGLQSLNSGSKFLRESPISPFNLPKTSPNRLSQSGPQKKLFADDNISESQALDDLADVCSGNFTTQTQDIENTKATSVKTEIYNEPTSTTQELFDICSGTFTGITQIESKTSESAIKDSDSIQPSSTTYISMMRSNDEIKDFNDKNEEEFISELLNEDERELEEFKKKFESPQEVIRGKILDSDDENELVSPQKPKKKIKNCIEDDDNDEDDKNVEENENNEEINDDFEDNDSENNDKEEEPREIEYDSEENEIVVDHQKEKLKLADFFEEEAELSESEWGSADEDEKDTDILEFEEGDNDKLDERKVKRDLERIHMRRILDDDKHEVKLLQEIFLDDGELHGKGRERQFKWRNINNSDINDGDKKDDDGEVYLEDDDVNEEEWRKKRYEREIFLKKQQEVSESFEESTLVIQSSSKIFKLGQAAIKRSLSNTPNNSSNTNNSDKGSSPDFKSSLTLVSKKGSFLSRSEQVLARVAEFTSKTVNPTIGGAKNSRNFVFHTIQSREIEIQETNIKKRKADGNEVGTPVAIKRLRLNNLSPAVRKNKSEKVEKVKNLFGSANW